MSSLTVSDNRYLEQLLGMQNGYVLNYSDSTFGSLFARHNIDIHSTKYRKYGTSKANKLRAFWELEADALVRSIISDLLDAYQIDCDLAREECDAAVLEKCRAIAARLTGKPTTAASIETADTFLDREFSIPNVQQLPVDAMAMPVIQSRLDEARKALQVGAHLSVVFLCGSVLEAVLLGAAQKEPTRFNRAAASPKTADGSVKRFHEWKLAEFIDVAYEVGLLKLDVKKFSHGLRDFRNYIHPYEQMVSGFSPDEHTAKVCFQVLKAALASVAGERR